MIFHMKKQCKKKKKIKLGAYYYSAHLSSKYKITGSWSLLPYITGAPMLVSRRRGRRRHQGFLALSSAKDSNLGPISQCDRETSSPCQWGCPLGDSLLLNILQKRRRLRGQKKLAAHLQWDNMVWIKIFEKHREQLVIFLKDLISY